jgi:hypothetical protein
MQETLTFLKIWLGVVFQLTSGTVIGTYLVYLVIGQ